MAKAQTKVTTKSEADDDLDALRTRVEAILTSNGFEGTKTANEITAAVGEFVGRDLAPAKEEETKSEE